MLVAHEQCRDVAFDGVLGEGVGVVAADDKGLGHFGAVWAFHADDGGVLNIRMGAQDAFKLGGRDLPTAD